LRGAMSEEGATTSPGDAAVERLKSFLEAHADTPRLPRGAPLNRRLLRITQHLALAAAATSTYEKDAGSGDSAATIALSVVAAAAEAALWVTEEDSRARKQPQALLERQLLRYVRRNLGGEEAGGSLGDDAVSVSRAVNALHGRLAKPIAAWSGGVARREGYEAEKATWPVRPEGDQTIKEGLVGLVEGALELVAALGPRSSIDESIDSQVTDEGVSTGTEELRAEIRDLRLLAEALSEELTAAASALGDHGRAVDLELIGRLDDYGARLADLARRLTGEAALASTDLAGLETVASEFEAASNLSVHRMLNELVNLAVTATAAEADAERVRQLASGAVRTLDQGGHPEEVVLAGLSALHRLLTSRGHLLADELNEALPQVIAAGIAPALALPPLVDEVVLPDAVEAPAQREFPSQAAETEPTRVGERQVEERSGPAQFGAEPGVTEDSTEPPESLASADAIEAEDPPSIEGLAEPPGNERPEGAGHAVRPSPSSSGGRPVTLVEEGSSDEALATDGSARSPSDSTEPGAAEVVALGDEGPAEGIGGQLEESLNDDLASALAAHDFSLALWLSRATQDPSVSDGVLEAVALADSLSNRRDDTADALEQALQPFAGECSDPVSGLLLAAAALRAAVLSPYGMAGPVLRASSRALGAVAPAAQELCMELANRAQGGAFASIGLDEQAQELSEAESKVRALSAQAGQGLERWPQETHVYTPASSVWRRWATGSGPMALMLEIVSANQSERRTELEALIDEYSDERRVRRQMDETFKALTSRPRTGRIVSSAERWIRERVQRVVTLAREWSAASAHLDTLGSGAAETNLVELRTALQQHRGAARRELETLLNAGGTMSAASALLLTEEQALYSYVIETRSRTLTPRSPSVASNRALVRAVDLLLDENGKPVVDVGGRAPDPGDSHFDPSSVAALRQAANCDWTEAFERRLEAGDHAATRVAIEAVRETGDDALAEELERRRDDDILPRRTQLRRHAQGVELRLDRFLRMGLLDPVVHDRARRRLRVVDTNETVAFPYADAVLAAIERDLTEVAAARTTGLRVRLEEISPSTVARERVTLLIDEEQFDVAEELLDRLDRGEQVEQALEERDWLGEFLAVVETLSAPGNKPFAALEERRDVGVADFSRLSDTERKEGLTAVSTLRGLQHSQQGDRRVRDALQILFTMLGLALDPDSVKRQPRALPRAGVYEVAARPITVSFIPPEFGSMAAGQYRVLVVRGAVNEQELVGMVKQERARASAPVIVFSLDPFSLPRRRSVARQARIEKSAFLLVDEYTLLFLALHRTAEDGGGAAPFDLLLATSLPFGRLNPYVLRGLPPEMFFGRGDQLDSLEDPFGSCFIYGGRQLGKTALLRRLYERTNAPDEDRVAILLDLKAEGVGERLPPDALWGVIASRLDDLNIASGSGQDAGSVSKRITTWLYESPRRRFRLLLDETDGFLDQDARPGEAAFANVLQLRRLMDDTDRRFKAILAGLHNVQRFQRIPNQPLAHFGTPRPVGPLTWGDARELVEVPLRLLGFRFDPPELVDRILVDTRRHPSLIQLVCHALIEHFASQGTRSAQPPFVIRSEDLDRVDQSADLTERIRERFEWTLDLDPRYRVLALALAARSSEDEEIRAAGLPPKELYDLVRSIAKPGFAPMALDEFKVLLGEMVDLEVLAASEGRYRLPAGGILRLLGSNRDEIEERLLTEAANLEPPVKFAPARLRRPLEKSGRPARSPLTYSDEEALLGRDGPLVRIVFGTPATRVELVSEALRRCAEAGEWPGLDVVADDRRLDLEALRHRPSSGGSRTSRKAFVGHVREPVEGRTDEFLDNLKRLAENLKKRSSPDVVIPIIDHRALHEWVEIQDELELELGGLVEWLELKRWDEVQLRAWLDDLELPVRTIETQSEILELTGGWPVLLDRVGERLLEPGVDWRDALEASEKDPDFLLDLRTRLALDSIPSADSVLPMLAQYAPDPIDAFGARDLFEDLDYLEIDRVLRTLVAAQAASASDQGVVLQPVVTRALNAALDTAE
jgi:hypothetical protein